MRRGGNMRWWTLFGALVAIMLVAAGCGDDSDEPGDSPELPLSVGGLLAAEPTAEVSVVGSVVIDSSGSRLCSALAESFPPQCGGESVDLVNIDDFDLALEEAQGVRWSDLPVVLTGAYADGTFTITSLGERED